MRPPFLILAVLLLAAPLSRGEPLSPIDEQKTIRALPGFRVELVASEPNLVDPVAMSFDERGRLFVCEMRGYPNGGVATGAENRGRIRLLTDRDGDGLFETAIVFAVGLRFPTGVLPWRTGVIVTAAPDILFLDDTDGDGKADRTTVLYTGFGLDNIQQIINTPRWGMDGWVYCTVGSSGGTITSPLAREMRPLVLRGRGVRFKPDNLASIEPTSGGGQYGLTSDESQQWFVNTNSAHLKQIVLPEHYLRRNPYLSVPSTTIDISEHGAACRVFRVSPFEAWRVERTTRRKDSPDAKRFASNELVPGGFVTSGCSPMYYSRSEPLFPERDRGCVYVCDPANNLITRDKLEPNGAVYRGRRIDDGVEFIASTDNWFRPVCLDVGPDGALYLLDFYREVIETPLSLPEDIKKKLNLESRERGRAWRIVPESYRFQSRVIDASNESSLIRALTSLNAWERNTAHRLLAQLPVEKRPRMANAWNVGLAPEAKVSLLFALAQTRELSATHLERAIVDDSPMVRIASLKLSEPFLDKSAELRSLLQKRANDPDGMVRLQAVFSAGELPAVEAAGVVSSVLRDSRDRWMTNAALSSVGNSAPATLRTLIDAKATDPGTLQRMASLVGARGNDDGTSEALRSAVSAAPEVTMAVVEGLGEGLRVREVSLAHWLARPENRELANLLAPVFRAQVAIAIDHTATMSRRLSATRFLASAPAAISGEPLGTLLQPQVPPDLQMQALRSLAASNDASAARIVLSAWEGLGPNVRRESLDRLLTRRDWTGELLTAIEKKTVPSNQLSSTQAESLRQHVDPAIRERSTRLLSQLVSADRKKVVDDYSSAIDAKGDLARGREVFRKNCTACHRLENVGHEVGASLQSALKNKTRSALLLDILDPNREVDARFVNYRLTTHSGRTVTGILATDAAASVTLRRGEQAEDTILRSQIDELKATGKSLMPEELEKQISREQMADLLEYLLRVVQ